MEGSRSGNDRGLRVRTCVACNDARCAILWAELVGYSVRHCIFLLARLYLELLRWKEKSSFEFQSIILCIFCMCHSRHTYCNNRKLWFEKNPLGFLLYIDHNVIHFKFILLLHIFQFTFLRFIHIIMSKLLSYFEHN